MKRIRLLGFCLAVVFTMSALAASAAVAAVEPIEFLNSKGKSVEKKKFTSASLKAPVLSAGGIKLECKKSTGSGEINGKSAVKGVTVTYTECQEAVKKCKVNSVGAKEGEIKTKALKGELGEIPPFGETEASKAGEDLEPEVGTVFTEIAAKANCIIATKVEGSVIGEATPINKLATTGKLVFAESGGKQAIKEIELGGSGGTLDTKDTLKAFGVESKYLGEEEVKFEEAVEVKVPA